MLRIESLLSARLFLQPQISGEQIFFQSNLSGHISLYVMRYGGSIPEPLLPPQIALQNPHLMDGPSYRVFPKLGKVLVMIDQDGDENYQPMFIPMTGGYPEPAFGEQFAGQRVHLTKTDVDANLAYFVSESRQEQLMTAYQGDLASGSLVRLGESQWGSFVEDANQDNTKVVMTDGYTSGDNIIYLWEQGQGERRLIYGTPLEDRLPGETPPLPAFFSIHFTRSGKGLLLGTALFSDRLGLGYLDLASTEEVKQVEITGEVHTGVGEFEHLTHLTGERYLLTYNIDGASWVYEGLFDEQALQMRLEHPIVGVGELSNGVLESIKYDKESDCFALAFSTATSPTQIYTVEGKDRSRVVRHTNERILGLPDAWLSQGEDASYTSFDGTRISARLYFPSPELNYSGPRPVVYYIHGGPQGQERPDFAWFSMPLIQFLTLSGFAVFVPNVRGSTGYGLNYMKQVDRDWGGKDRLDHVHAMQEVLPKDSRLDVSRAGVVGRSYGGYMTLMLSGRHPELWSAAVDMFGPYDLLTFMDRIPETWKPYFAMAVGDPLKDHDLLVEASPRTYLHQLGCPLLVIQGKNDPRVIEQESRDLVENLRADGKDVTYLMFENEGHDVLKYENRVTTYSSITEFFKDRLRP